jgi:hypothetical protein
MEMDSVLCDINWHCIYSLNGFVFKQFKKFIWIEYLNDMLLKLTLIKMLNNKILLHVYHQSVSYMMCGLKYLLIFTVVCWFWFWFWKLRHHLIGCSICNAMQVLTVHLFLQVQYSRSSVYAAHYWNIELNLFTFDASKTG